MMRTPPKKLSGQAMIRTMIVATQPMVRRWISHRQIRRARRAC
jgi:hypothetical protein